MIEPPEVTVIRPGTDVTIKNAGLPATITGSMVKSNMGVIYEVCWWNGHERKSEWFQECEIVPREYTMTRIGFVQ